MPQRKHRYRLIRYCCRECFQPQTRTVLNRLTERQSQRSLQLCISSLDQGLNWGEGIPPDLRSDTSCLRSTTSNNRSCTTTQFRSGTFLLGSTTLHGLYLRIFLCTMFWKKCSLSRSFLPRDAMHPRY